MELVVWSCVLDIYFHISQFLIEKYLFFMEKLVLHVACIDLYHCNVKVSAPELEVWEQEAHGPYRLPEQQ